MLAALVALILQELWHPFAFPLLLALSRKQKPSLNAILFMGDRVEGTGNPIIEKLSRLENVAAVLVSKLGASVNAWVVEASTFRGPFACYEEFLTSLSPAGEPACYDPRGLPAARAVSSLLNDSLRKVSSQLGSKCYKVEHLTSNDMTSSNEDLPRTLIFGFSKGGVVLNQLLAELAHVVEQEKLSGDVQGSTLLKMKQEKQTESDEFNNDYHKMQVPFHSAALLPTTCDIFLKSISEIHYVDVGLNCHGAYQTDPRVLEGVVKFAALRNLGLHIAFHGTPRQWNDYRRHWICSEKDRCIELLRHAANKLGSDKLRITEKLYFGERSPSLQMHFEILETLDLL